MPRRLHGRRAMRSVPAAAAAWVLLSGVAAAVEPCAVFAPGADGVLRLDGGHADGCLTAGPRVGRALPETPESRSARPKAEQVRPQAEASPGASSPPSLSVQPPAISPAPVVRSPASQAPMPADQHATADAAGIDVVRLKAETALLRDETAQLRDEVARLRAETARLKDERVQRDPAPASTGSIAPGARTSRVGKAEGAEAAGKIEGKVDVAPPSPAAPKGDLLVTEPQSSAAVKTPAGGKSVEKPADVSSADPHSVERQANVVARAWKQLRDLAGRMKADGPGKTE